MAVPNNLNALLIKVAGGDENAFRHLVQEKGQSMFGQAYKITGNAAAAEDIVQDALIKIWRSAASFRAEKGSAVAYIARITHNCAIDYFRKTKHQAALLDNDLKDNAPNSETIVALKQQSATLMEAIDTLPDAQKQAVLLFYFHDLSTAAVAKSLNKSKKSVEGLLARARKSLEQLLLDTIDTGVHRYG